MSRRAVLAGLGGGLAAAALPGCSVVRHPSGTATTQAATTPVPTSSANPLGVASGSTVQFWADTSRYPADWTQQLVTAAAQASVPLTVRVNQTSLPATDLRSRIVGGSGVDLVLNGGQDPLGIAEVAPKLADLGHLLDLSDGQARLHNRLRAGAVDAGTIGGRVVGLPYVMTVYGLWYSATLLEQHDWSAPSDFDALMGLGERAHSHGMYLFCWGRETATWFLRMAVAAAVKQGGEDVRRRMDELDASCWRQQDIRSALQRVKDLVDAGYVKPGGATRAWKDAVGAWATDGKVLFVPAGSWIGSQTGVDEKFALSVAPDPLLGQGAAMPAAALHASPQECFLVPTSAANPAGARDVLELAFSPAVAKDFCTRNQVVSTLVDVTVDDPGSGLRAQHRALQAAGQHVFGWRFIDAYGTNHDFQALWNGFLAGSLDVETLVVESQAITDLVREDPAQVKYRTS